MFGGNYAPYNWHLCDGTLLPIQGNEQLYSLLGQTWGGDGRTTFGLPDLRGRQPVGQGHGTNLTDRVLGAKDGAETVTLTNAQVGGHNHTFNVVAANATTDTPGTGMLYGQPMGGDVFYVPTSTGQTAVTLDARSVQGSPGVAPHVNCMPSLTVNFIIALQGLYPARP